MNKHKQTNMNKQTNQTHQHIANLHPSMVLQCLAVLTRSPWPCKMLLTCLHVFLPWNKLSDDEILIVFYEVIII